MVPEIWSATDIIFCHSWLFFGLLPPYGPRKSKFWKKKLEKTPEDIIILQKHKWQSYDLWFLRYGVQRTEFLSFWTIFLPFYPPKNPKNQSFEKLKKTPEDITILHKCNKNHDYMLYCSLHMACNGFNYFSFWAIFYPFTRGKGYESRSSDSALGYFISTTTSQQHKILDKRTSFIIFGG